MFFTKKKKKKNLPTSFSILTFSRSIPCCSFVLSVRRWPAGRSGAVVPVLVLLFVALWFILRGDLLYIFPCVILFLCFSVLLVLRLPRLGRSELVLVLFVRLFGLCLFGFVGFLFLLGSGKGCGLWLWHSLDFSLTFFFFFFFFIGDVRFVTVWSSCIWSSFGALGGLCSVYRFLYLYRCDKFRSFKDMHDYNIPYLYFFIPKCYLLLKHI